MSKRDNRINEISNEINEHIMAVRGTLELASASLSNTELQDLLLKAIDRVDKIQNLNSEIFSLLKQVLEKMAEIKSTKEDMENN